MESLSENPVFKFRPDTLFLIRQLYNLEIPARMDEAIDILQDWINQQNHFVHKEYDRKFLERAIIFNKGSVERAKARLDKTCAMRTIVPEFSNSCKVTHDGLIEQIMLPDLTPENYRVYILRIRDDKLLTPEIITNKIYDTFVTIEYIINHDYNAGFVGVADLRNINLLNVMSKTNFNLYRKAHEIIRECYGFRIKGIHILSGSRAIEKLVSLLKLIFPEKVANRINVHNSVETLYKFLPKDMLTKDYGGNAPSFDEIYKIMMKEVNSEEHTKHMEKTKQYKTDESKRIGGKTDIYSLAGTFRNLVVD